MMRRWLAHGVPSVPLLKLAILLAAALPPFRSSAASCVLTGDGEVLRVATPTRPRLEDPLCFIKTSTSSLDVTIFDGRYVESRIGLIESLNEHTRVEIRIPATCDGHRSKENTRAMRSQAQLVVVKRHALGSIERTPIDVDTRLTCTPSATKVALTSDKLFQFVATARASARSGQ